MDMSAYRPPLSTSPDPSTQPSISEALITPENMALPATPISKNSDDTPPQKPTLDPLDPVASIQAIAADVAQQVAETIAREVAEAISQKALNEGVTDQLRLELSTLRDEAELRGALKSFLAHTPEARDFEPFIMQEVAAIIEADDDGMLAPWSELLAQGYQQFQKKFETLLAQQSELVVSRKPESKNNVALKPSVPHMEGSTQRNMPEEAPTFTRKQIARMTPAEFAKHEAAIEMAMKHNRIQS